jgi:flagellar biosynthesis protein FlhB
MAEELGERTEKPTGRKLGRARNDGNVAKSSDFSAAIDLSGAFLAIIFLGPGLIAGMAAILRTLLDGSSFGVPDRQNWIDHLLEFTATRGALLVAPFLIILFIVAFAAQFMQVGWLWTLKPIMPKLHKLNPLNGAKRMLGKTTAAKMAVNSLKLAIVGAVAVIISVRNVRKLASLPALEVVPALTIVGNMIINLLMWLILLLLIIGIADFLFQRWHRILKLKMTKQEVKEEIKSVEGDLQAKARRLRMGRALVYQQMAQGVKTADVVVTNPTHFSVALKYDADKMAAPTVVAKGADHMAFRIRQLARDSGVPIVEKPPLARGLYHGVEVGRAILPEYYQAVAEILAYVYRLKGKAA